MRVAFQNGPVHKSAWVTFVCVTADVFDVVYRTFCEFPLHPCREASAPAPSQPGTLNDIDDLIRTEFGQAFAERSISVKRDIFINVFGIDQAAVPKSDTLLLLIKIYLVQRVNALLFSCAFLMKQFGHNTAL
jgi:hypothetical protein